MSGTAGYGYGICGHKNTYCCGVMNGNYVEDQYGRDLAKMETRGEAFLPQSTSQESYIDPKDMVDRAGDADKFQSNPLDDQRGGLSAELLFSHDGDLPAREKAKLKPGPLKIGGTLPHPCTQMREHAKRVNRQAYDLKHPTTEAVQSQKHALKPAFRIRVEDAEPLPVFNRRKLMC